MQMKQKHKTLMLGITIGIVLGCCVSTPVGSAIWFNNSPSISELRSVIVENMTLTEQELNQVTQMVIIGSMIDFTLQLMMYVIPASCIGGIFGMLGSFLWIRKNQKNTEQ